MAESAASFDDSGSVAATLTSFDKVHREDDDDVEYGGGRRRHDHRSHQNRHDHQVIQFRFGFIPSSGKHDSV
ncbi:hypothetical protein Hanom_Chr02g00112471 [Helianthus anomalus]